MIADAEEKGLITPGEVSFYFRSSCFSLICEFMLCLTDIDVMYFYCFSNFKIDCNLLVNLNFF